MKKIPDMQKILAAIHEKFDARIDEAHQRISKLERAHLRLKNKVNRERKSGRPATALEAGRKFLRRKFKEPGQMILVRDLMREFPYSEQVLRKAREELDYGMVMSGGQWYWERPKKPRTKPKKHETKEE